ncbi:MAG: hypothetical protein ACQEQM_05765 [Thermoplasmatota archaeon]
MIQIQIKLRKKYNENEKETLKNQILDEFESVDRLRQKVSRAGCTEPELVDKLQIIEYLQKGADYKEETISHSEKSLSVMTHKRVYLMEYIAKNEVKSIQDLANKLDRDYKNVYDDVKVLFDNGLIDLEKVGKRRIPILTADNIIIEF